MIRRFSIASSPTLVLLFRTSSPSSIFLLPCPSISLLSVLLHYYCSLFSSLFCLVCEGRTVSSFCYFPPLNQSLFFCFPFPSFSLSFCFLQFNIYLPCRFPFTDFSSKVFLFPSIVLLLLPFLSPASFLTLFSILLFFEFDCPFFSTCYIPIYLLLPFYTSSSFLFHVVVQSIVCWLPHCFCCRFFCLLKICQLCN